MFPPAFLIDTFLDNAMRPLDRDSPRPTAASNEKPAAAAELTGTGISNLPTTLITFAWRGAFHRQFSIGAIRFRAKWRSRLLPWELQPWGIHR